MAHLHNLRKNQKPSFLDGIGQKVRSVAEIVGTAKGLYDVGKGLYTFGRMAAPVITAFKKIYKLIYIYMFGKITKQHVVNS